MALPLWLEQSGGEGASGRAGREQCDAEGSSRFKHYGPLSVCLSVCLCAVRWVCVCLCVCCAVATSHSPRGGFSCGP